MPSIYCHRYFLMTGLLAFTLFISNTYAGGEGKGKDGHENSRDILLRAKKELLSELDNLDSFVFDEDPSRRDKVRTAVANLKLSENMQRERDGKNLMFDFGWDNGVPYIEALQLYFEAFASHGPEMQAHYLPEVKRSLLHESSHLWGFADSEARDFASEIYPTGEIDLSREPMKTSAQTEGAIVLPCKMDIPSIVWETVEYVPFTAEAPWYWRQTTNSPENQKIYTDETAVIPRKDWDLACQAAKRRWSGVAPNDPISCLQPYRTPGEDFLSGSRTQRRQVFVMEVQIGRPPMSSEIRRMKYSKLTVCLAQTRTISEHMHALAEIAQLRTQMESLQGAIDESADQEQLHKLRSERSRKYHYAENERRIVEENARRENRSPLK